MWGAIWSRIRGTFFALRDAVRRPSPLYISPGSPPDSFPDPARVPHDIVAFGGDLSVARLLSAYRRGLFPYYESAPVLWWSPDPRAVLEIEHFHVSRRLARTVRSGKFTVTVDTAFEAVIRACADRGEGTWIDEDMIAAYEALHRAGHAHSVEVWHKGELVGGVYGVAIGGLFAGESMFYRVRDASKVALVHLVARLRERGFVLFDVQILNDHTRSLGGVEIPRREFLKRLGEAVRRNVAWASGNE